MKKEIPGFSTIRKKLINGEISIEYLSQLRGELFFPMARSLMNGGAAPKRRELEAFLLLCLDYYVYSENGEVLIPDRLYDVARERYILEHGEITFCADSLRKESLSGPQWKKRKHVAPGMVGTLKKSYTKEELEKWLESMGELEYGRDLDDFKLILAPKYDGVSACLHMVNCELDYAVTRGDGVYGSDITETIQEALKARQNDVIPVVIRDGYIKCELLVSKDDFEDLQKIHPYSNRRSAASAIVSSPKNRTLGNFLTIIPLARLSEDQTDFRYLQSFDHFGLKKKKTYLSTMAEVEARLEEIRDPSYPFRVDGVVLYPESMHLIFRPDDVMSNAIAFKVNTMEAKTRIKRLTISVGRLGNAVPMAVVEPADVNETVVTNVSLGSFDKLAGMGLREGEEVVVFAAGDVIPQIRLPKHRKYPEGAPYLELEKVCPFCLSPLTRKKRTYACMNPNCRRVATGKIGNFLVKLGADGISDRTVEELYDAGIVESIKDLFDIREDQIDRLQSLPGWGETSVSATMEEIRRVLEEPIGISKLIGALGIEGIAEKKARKIFQRLPITDLQKGKFNWIYERILDIDGIGCSTAQIFCTFLKEEWDLIQFLLSRMNVNEDVSYKGNVVFTGFRSDELGDRFKQLGYDVSSSVNGETVVVINGQSDTDSGTCQRAKKKHIPIVHRLDVDEVFHDMKKNRTNFENYGMVAYDDEEEDDDE